MLAMALPSLTGDGAAETTRPRHDVDVESCRRRRCRGMLEMALPRRLGRDAMSMLTHAMDGAVKSC
jgi:hypothetical protein